LSLDFLLAAIEGEGRSRFSGEGGGDSDE